MKKYFQDMPIKESVISVFGSGNSINNMPSSEVEQIKQHSFMITMNYAPIKLVGHVNMWSDKKVSTWLNDFYAKRDKNNIFLARERAFRNSNLPLYGKVDYWFDEKREKLGGNYTIVWLLQLLEKYFPQKKVLVFGLDMQVIDNKRSKWYDDHTDYDRAKRGNVRIERKLNLCANQMDRYLRNKEMFINCTKDSMYEGFTKSTWQTIIG